MPYVADWNEKYAGPGFTIVGVHTPEFSYEKLTENVVEAAGKLGVVWPIAQDNDYRTWRSYDNIYWPAKYLIDASGVIRFTHFGEGRYEQTEHHIRALMEEAGREPPDVTVGRQES